jgi:hypothetical protein
MEKVTCTGVSNKYIQNFCKAMSSEGTTFETLLI